MFCCGDDQVDSCSGGHLANVGGVPFGSGGDMGILPSVSKQLE